MGLVQVVKPAAARYVHQDFPSMVYKVGKKGNLLTKVAQNPDELGVLVDGGWVSSPEGLVKKVEVDEVSGDLSQKVADEAAVALLDEKEKSRKLELRLAKAEALLKEAGLEPDDDEPASAPAPKSKGKGK